MRRKWMTLCSLLVGALPVLGSCGVTGLQLQDFAFTTASRALITTILNVAQATVLQNASTTQ